MHILVVVPPRDSTADRDGHPWQVELVLCNLDQRVGWAAGRRGRHLGHLVRPIVVRTGQGPCGRGKYTDEGGTHGRRAPSGVSVDQSIVSSHWVALLSRRVGPARPS